LDLFFVCRGNFPDGLAVLLRLFWIGKRKFAGIFASLTMPAEAHLLTPCIQSLSAIPILFSRLRAGLAFRTLSSTSMAPFRGCAAVGLI
jgi:hypothetical protein